jgi:putative FmdB family regulatory protein
MPIYEYRCTSCGHELEVLQKITDQPITECPACKRDALQKKVSAAGFQLKGSGWYVTDFRNKGAKPAAKGDGKGAGANGSDGDAKSESKAETTTETTSTKSDGGTETKSTTTASADKSST